MSHVTHRRKGNLWKTWCGKVPDQVDAPIVYGNEQANCPQCRSIRDALNRDDTLARADCKMAGHEGHRFCGVCDEHQEPRTICQCIGPARTAREASHDTPKKETKMKDETPQRDNRNFLLEHIRVCRINIETVPSETMANIARSQGREPDDSWQDIVIKVEDSAGNEFEVERIHVHNFDEMLSQSTASAKLVNERSWRDEERPDVTCAVCFFPGHGAGACDRLQDNELPWPQPISVYDSNGPRDGGPVEFNIAGASFLVVKADDSVAPDTGRDRYKVVCRDCDDILHKATTSPPSYIEAHLKKVHDYHRKLTHAEAV